jgi:hypothetical protein
MMTVRKEVDEAPRLHFQGRAEESGALAQAEAFRNRRGQFLHLARRYEVLSCTPEQRQARGALWMRRALP